MGKNYNSFLNPINVTHFSLKYHDILYSYINNDKIASIISVNFHNATKKCSFFKVHKKYVDHNIEVCTVQSKAVFYNLKDKGSIPDSILLCFILMMVTQS